MKVIISESQAKYIAESELLNAVTPDLPEFFADKPVQSQNPFINTGYFVNGVLTKLAKERQREILGYFNDDIASYDVKKIYSKLSKLITKCKKLEEPIKEQLEKICLNTVVNLFAIPNGSLEISCELVSDISQTKSFHIKPDTDEEREYDTIGDIEQYDAETNKRRIINAISCGAAKCISEQSTKLWINDIFELDEELPHLYSEIMKINDYLIFTNDIKIEDKDHKQGGFVNVKLSHEDQISSIEAVGIIFPILLQETVRGIVDILSTYGLPDDIDSAKRVANIADALENDPWNMRFGPAMWNRILVSIPKFQTENFSYFYKELTELSVEDFSVLMKEVFAGTKRGKTEIEAIYNRSKYNEEYNQFTNDLALKRGKDIIDDDCFTEEELSDF